jgi:hypothetical protein
MGAYGTLFEEMIDCLAKFRQREQREYFTISVVPHLNVLFGSLHRDFEQYASRWAQY